MRYPLFVKPVARTRARHSASAFVRNPGTRGANAGGASGLTASRARFGGLWGRARADVAILRAGRILSPSPSRSARWGACPGARASAARAK